MDRTGTGGSTGTHVLLGPLYDLQELFFFVLGKLPGGRAVEAALLQRSGQHGALVLRGDGRRTAQRLPSMLSLLPHVHV